LVEFPEAVKIVPSQEELGPVLEVVLTFLCAVSHMSQPDRQEIREDFALYIRLALSNITDPSDSIFILCLHLVIAPLQILEAFPFFGGV
jgi:hypothetical protein